MIDGCSKRNSAKCFAKDGLQEYLVFQPLFKYFQAFAGTDEVFT